VGDDGRKQLQLADAAYGVHLDNDFLADLFRPPARVLGLPWLKNHWYIKVLQLPCEIKQP
jgi:hypothetical protein